MQKRLTRTPLTQPSTQTQPKALPLPQVISVGHPLLAEVRGGVGVALAREMEVGVGCETA